MSTATVSGFYLALIGRFPLLPIASEEQLDRATEVAEELSDREHSEGLAPDERGYFQVLCGLIEVYEEQHYPMPPVSGAEMARYLMEEKGLTPLEVATATGLPTFALSEVLAGKREFSMRYVKSLAKYLGVSPAVFIED